MEPYSLSNINNYKNNNTNYCLNCHSNNLSSSSLITPFVNNEVLVIKQEEGKKIPQTSTSSSSNIPSPTPTDYDITEDVRQSYLKTTFIEVLSYVFDLHVAHISQLQQLNVNEMKICRSCDEHLTNVYQSRKAFLSLTAPNSRIFAILTSKYDDPTTATAKDIYDTTTTHDMDPTENFCNILNDNNNDHGDSQFDIDESGEEEEDEEDPLRITSTIFPIPNHTNASRRVIAQPSKIPSTTTTTTNPQYDEPKNEPAIKRCFRCSKSFRTEFGLRKDYRGYSTPTRNRPIYEDHIKVCTYIDRGDLSKYDAKDPNLAVLCSICHNPNVDTKLLKQHLFEHMGPEERIQELTCSDCGMVLGSLRNLAGHRLSAHPIPKPVRIPKEELAKKNYYKPIKRSFTCPECGKRFLSVVPNALTNHINLVHRKTSKHTCEICGKPVQSLFEMKLHLQTHLGLTEKEGITKPFLCAECGTSFLLAWQLKDHIAIVHEKTKCKPKKSKRKYTCNKCNAVRSSSKTFKRHMRGHELEEHGVYNVNCSYCPMKFKFEIELRQHELICEGQVAQRPFQCLEEGCIKRFKNKQVLEVHLNEFHKYGPEKARQMVYPGLPPRKLATKEEKRESKRRTARERKRRAKSKTC